MSDDDAHASPPGLDAEALRVHLGLQSRYLAGRLLAALTATGGELRSVADFEARAAALRDGDVVAKLGLLFHLCDSDGSGRLDREELDRILHIELAEHGILLAVDDAGRLLEGMIREADLDADDRLDFAEFCRVIEQRPALRDRLAAHGVLLLRSAREARAVDAGGGAWIRSRALVGAWIVAFVAVHLWLFVGAFLHYRGLGANLWVQIARGCGACLNLDVPLLLVPMLRHFWTVVRRTPLAAVFPLDESVGAHKMIGEVIFALSLIHTVAHLINAAVVGASLASPAFLTGAALLVILLVIWGFAREGVRARGRFELFHRVHATYWLWFVIAVFHGPVLWMWLVGPGALFVLEQAWRRRTRAEPSHLLEATVLPAGVTRLRFDRPLGFKYDAGDFIFLKVPAVARSEWHPFTLTSAPEDPDWLTVHVRALGNWTRALAERFAAPASHRGERVHVDGPYGTPSVHLWDSEHVVTIASGIGVTPFASILQSLQIRRRRGDPGLRLRRLHFVWISRDQGSFAWFRQLLGELEREGDGWLDIQIYFTAARGDLGGVVELARELLRESEGADIVTGLQARTHFGRPDLGQLLDRFAAEPGLPAPAVFFCGPDGLARELTRTCASRGLRFRYERF